MRFNHRGVVLDNHYNIKLVNFIALADTMARMSLRAEASRLFLSYLWWLLEPLLYVAVFYLVFDVLLSRGKVNFFDFLIVGKIIFLLFSKGVAQCSNSLRKAKGLIGHADMPKVLFPLAELIAVFYKHTFVFGLLLIGLCAFGYTPSWYWLLLFPLHVSIYMLTLTCGMIASIFVALARDFSYVVTFILTGLMFSSGIFWDVRSIQDPALQQAILTINPVAFFIDAYRAVLLNNTFFDLTHFYILSISVLGVFFVTIGLMTRLDRKIAAWVLFS